MNEEYRPLVSLAEFEQALNNREQKTIYQVLYELEQYRRLVFGVEKEDKAMLQASRATRQMIQYLCKVHGIDHKSIEV